MARLALTSRLRWLGAVVVLLLLLTPPVTTSAQGEEGGECGDTSTPNLVVTAINAGQDAPRLTLTVHTNKDAIPNWNIIFRDGSNVLDSYEIHRVFLKGHEGEESLSATAEEGCGEDDEGCGGDESGMVGAGTRGIGYVNGVKMRFQIDLKDYGNNPDKPDMARVRWRVFVEGDSGHDDSGNCEEKGWTNNFWFAVQQINIHQR